MRLNKEVTEGAEEVDVCRYLHLPLWALVWSDY
jgi:hypothetical protein